MKPCDVGNLRIEVKEPNSTEIGDDVIAFETIKAANGIATQRPRDLALIGNEPVHIRNSLAGYDLVIEVIASPSDKAKASATAPGAVSDTRYSLANAQSKASAKPSSGVATLSVNAVWDASCGDPVHAATFLTKGSNPTIQKEKSFSHTISSKSKADVGDLWTFVTSGLDPRVLGKSYEVVARSCGVTTQGPPTTGLRALVTAFHPGTTGMKLSFAGFSGNIGWTTNAHKEVENYNQDAQPILDNTTTEQLENRLDKVMANGARLSEKRPKGREAKSKHIATMKTNQQEIARVKNLLERKAELDQSRFSYGAVLFDEEIDVPETARKIEAAIANVQRARDLLDRLMNVMTFITAYNPGLITPLMEITWTAGVVELFVGLKLNGDPQFKGARWRALPMCFGIEFNAKLLEFGGSFGVIVGKRLLGTGATAEVLIAPTIGASLGAEYTSPLFFDQPAPGWKDTELQLIGDARITGTVVGKVTFATFNIGSLEASVNASGRIFTKGTIGDVLSEKLSFTVYMTTDPAVGYVEARFMGLSDRYEYRAWEGGTTIIWS